MIDSAPSASLPFPSAWRIGTETMVESGCRVLDVVASFAPRARLVDPIDPTSRSSSSSQAGGADANPNPLGSCMGGGALGRNEGNEGTSIGGALGTRAFPFLPVLDPGGTRLLHTVPNPYPTSPDVLMLETGRDGAGKAGKPLVDVPVRRWDEGLAVLEVAAVVDVPRIVDDESKFELAICLSNSH